MPGVAEAGLLSPLKSGRQNGHIAGSPAKIDIIDIRRAAVEINLKEDIKSLFCPEKGPRKLPTLLLYDEKGLQLFEEVSLSNGIQRTHRTQG